MASPLPVDNRPFGFSYRTSKVLKVPIQYLMPYSANQPNPHDTMMEDILCSTCATKGNVKNVNPLNLGDGTLAEAPEVGRSYLWDFHTLRRNHKCSMCRLIWKTFRPLYEKLQETKAPDAVLGYNNGGKNGEPKWIKLVTMVYRDTMDNHDMRGTGSVYIYEDERVPHFQITQPALHEGSMRGKVSDSEWRQVRELRNDEIDFDLLKRWITMCSAEHGDICNTHGHNQSPAKRLIDVDSNCIVDGHGANEYLALSYVWGITPQYQLMKSSIKDAGQDGFLKSLGRKIPQTIRDAMQVCREVGVRHLWVDALCIVQDDDLEKTNQIGLMDEIYGRALTVLIVAAGKDAENGIPGMGDKKRDLVYYMERVGDRHLMTSLANTTVSAKRSTWNTRAWTYQEYILGKRLLVFSDTYIFYKCSSGVFRDDVSIHASDPIPSTPLWMDDNWILLTLETISRDLHPRKIWNDYYDSLLASYLRRDMKFHSDALPAFQGVLKVLSKYLGEFHFGLPRKYFSRSLLWNGAYRHSLTRRPEYPSWSWAGWKWAFNFYDAGRSTMGAYNYEMPKEVMPMRFYLFNEDGKLEAFFLEEPEEPAGERLLEDEKSSANPLTADQALSGLSLQHEQDRINLQGYNTARGSFEKPELTARNDGIQTGCMLRLLCQFVTPWDYLSRQYKDIISRHSNPDQLLAFYTSAARLQVPHSSEGPRKGKIGETLPYDVKGANNLQLFSCELDPAWRKTQPDSLEFILIGLKETSAEVVLMLVENIDSVYYRANWDWKTQHVSIEKWMDQDPIQKLIIMG